MIRDFGKYQVEVERHEESRESATFYIARIVKIPEPGLNDEAILALRGMSNLSEEGAKANLEVNFYDFCRRQPNAERIAEDLAKGLNNLVQTGLPIVREKAKQGLEVVVKLGRMVAAKECSCGNFQPVTINDKSYEVCRHCGGIKPQSAVADGEEGRRWRDED